MIGNFNHATVVYRFCFGKKEKIRIKIKKKSTIIKGGIFNEIKKEKSKYIKSFNRKIKLYFTKRKL